MGVLDAWGALGFTASAPVFLFLAVFLLSLGYYMLRRDDSDRLTMNACGAAALCGLC